ncbi:nucleoside deaminase [Gordonia sp. PS3]|uniref:nucleoside deaminase n=1 Tax=Gordonia TaxID=2053 RepID=UPI0005EEC1EF|nr:nucleoside deaminase [Gordonia sihwensis]KJR10164.1 cytidine deaminase [Gordonia sihwensis]WFN93370.1 nucleoside deaminase [Gordonia sihwensis]
MTHTITAPTDVDLVHLRRCITLAREALDSGDEPFGSLIVDAEGMVRFADRNRVGAGDHTRHPEFAIARWAAKNLTEEQRAAATVYTSGEHCPMCSAAHAWVGLGRIVYAVGARRLSTWRTEWGLPEGPVAALPINEVAPDVPVSGPAPELADEIRELHARSAGVNLT